MSKSLIAAAVLLAGFAVTGAGAQTSNPQQDKMARCNKEAGDKKGDERQAFMSQCLGAKSDGSTAQQEKMKKCNVDAKGKTGDERKKFMSECLKAKA
jgi:hypothetical protein